MPSANEPIAPAPLAADAPVAAMPLTAAPAPDVTPLAAPAPPTPAPRSAGRRAADTSKSKTARNGNTPVTVAPPIRSIADDVTRALINHWRVAGLVALGVMLLAWLFAAVQPKRYRAVAIAAVVPIADKLSASDMIRGVDSLERRVMIASVSALVTAPATQQSASATDDDDIAAYVLPNTNLFRIEVEGTNPARAAAIANRLVPALDSATRAMFRIYGVTLISTATAPRKHVLPRAGRAALAGLALGLLAGVAVAYVLDRRRFA